LPRIYVEATRDSVLPIETQRAFIDRGTPDEVLSLDTDHMLILSHADPVAC
jgi:hypothetical protein